MSAIPRHDVSGSPHAIPNPPTSVSQRAKRMGRHVRPLLAVVLFAGLLAAATLRTGAGAVEPPTMEGAWVGYAEDLKAFYRLDLLRNGRGYLAVSAETDSPIQLYGVQRWALEGDKLRLDIYPSDSRTRPMALQRLRYDHQPWIKLTVGGPGWEQDVTLFNEKVLLDRNRQLRERIEKRRSPEQ